MLQKLNERIQGLVAWIIITLVAITFMLFGVDYYMQSHHESNAQVEVNGQPITKQDLELSYKRTRQSREPSEVITVSEREIKQQLLNEMIANNVTVQSAINNGFDVTPSQADAAIVSIPQFQDKGRFSNDRYAQALNSAFFTPQSFQKEVRQGMLLNQQRFALIGTSFALPQEIKRFVKLYLQTRDYDYVHIPAAQFLKKTNVSEQDIATYYQEHRNDFLAPEQVSLTYIRLSLQDIKKTINIPESKIRHYYNENKATLIKPYSDVKVAIQEQLLAERTQTEYTETLEKLSDLSYQTPDSLKPVAEVLKMKIEETGLFSRAGGNSDLLKNKQIIQAAFSHDVLELGNNSDPVQLDNDTVIVLRINKHIPAAEKALVDVKPLIEHQLAMKQAEAEAMHVGNLLINTKNSVLQEEKLVSENNLKWNDVKQSARDSDLSPAAVNELAFTLGHVGDKAGLRMADGNFVVVSLRAINDGMQKQLDKELLSSITQQIEANYGVMDYELYVNSLISKADIVKH